MHLLGPQESPLSKEDIAALPKTRAALLGNPPPSLIYSSAGGNHVYKLREGVLLKISPSDLTEQVECLAFLQKNMPQIPVPRVLHHPSINRRRHRKGEISLSRDLVGGGNVWYICYRECLGVSLQSVVDTMAPSELDHVAEQLALILHRMASVRSSRIGTVSGGPHRNFWFPWWNYPKHAFDSVGDLLDWYRALFLTNGGEAWLNKVMALFPRNAAIVFTPGDLHPGNIIVQGSTITEVIDWHTGGFYPSYWDYARMHHPCFASVGWDHILGKVFPGEKRMDEIKACAEIIRIIDYTFAC